MRIFNIICIILFTVFAILQYNDPDPFLWMGFYGYAAFLCWIALHPHPKKMFFLSGLIVYSVYAIYLFFDKTGVLNWATAHGAENIAQSMKTTKPWIEETREFFGLVIVIVVVVINLVQISKKEKIAKAGISD